MWTLSEASLENVAPIFLAELPVGVDLPTHIVSRDSNFTDLGSLNSTSVLLSFNLRKLNVIHDLTKSQYNSPDKHGHDKIVQP